MQDVASTTTTIITPLAFEAGRIRMNTRPHQWPLLVCGPGRRGIGRLEDRCDIPAGHVVILAGLAGGLNPDLPAGHALLADAVVDVHGRERIPPLRSENGGGIICTHDELCDTPESKARLREMTGGDVVDMESIHFANLAEERGWTWGVIRGISDDHATPLPRGCDAWTDDGGRTRPWSIARSILSSPGIAMQLPGLKRCAGRAMDSVGTRLIGLLASDVATT